MVASVRSASQAGAATGNPVVTKPAGTVDGDVLLAVCFKDTDSAGGVVAPGGWTQQGATTTQGSVSRCSVFTKVASGEGASYTFTGNPGSTSTVAMLAITGADTTTPVDVGPIFGGGAASTSHVAPSISPTGADSLLVCSANALISGAVPTTYTPPGGMTEQTDLTTGNWLTQSSATQELAASGATGTKTFTCSRSMPHQTVSIAINSATDSEEHSGTATTSAASAVSSTGAKAAAGVATALAVAAALVGVGAKAATGSSNIAAATSVSSAGVKGGVGPAAAVTAAADLAAAGVMSAAGTGSISATAALSATGTMAAAGAATLAATAALTATGTTDASTTYRIFPATSGPAASSDDDAWVSLGLEFEVTEPATLTAFYFWMANAGVGGAFQDTAARTFRLYEVVDATTGTFVTDTEVVTGTTWTSQAWNRFALTTPVDLEVGQRYRAVVLSGVQNNYCSTGGYFTTGAGSGGIVSGPLSVPNAAAAVGGDQGSFAYGTTIQFPTGSFNGGLYWLDVEVEAAAAAPELAGSGTISAAAALTTAGTMGAAGTGTVSASADIAGTGTETVTKSGNGTAAAASSLSSTGVADRFGTGTVTEPSSIGSPGVTGRAGTASTSAAATLSATGDQDTSSAAGTATLTAAAALSSDGIAGRSGTGPVGASSAATGTGAKAATGAGSVTTAATLTGSTDGGTPIPEPLTLDAIQDRLTLVAIPDRLTLQALDLED